MLDGAGQHIGDGLDAAMRMPRKAGADSRPDDRCGNRRTAGTDRIRSVVPKPKARCSFTPAPSMVGVDCGDSFDRSDGHDVPHRFVTGFDLDMWGRALSDNPNQREARAASGGSPHARTRAPAWARCGFGAARSSALRALALLQLSSHAALGAAGFAVRDQLAVCNPAIEFLQGGRRVDQAPAVQVVAALGVEVARGRGEHLEHGPRIDRRMALQQQRRDAADMRGGDRGAGGELIGVVRRRHHDVDAGAATARCGPRTACVNRVSLIVGRGHRDHVRIGGRIERRRFRAHVARRRDQDDALGGRVAHRELDHRIVRAGEAHIDDACAFVDRPFDAGDDLPRGRFRRLPRRGAEGVHRQDVRVRRDAEELAVRHDRAGHAGAVRMRPAPCRPTAS